MWELEGSEFNNTDCEETDYEETDYEASSEEESSYSGSNIWKAIGGTLESITISTNKTKVIKQIQEHCRQLKHIDINSSKTEALSECLASFKGQLEYATMRYMEEHQLKRVVESCSNARFSLELTNNQDGCLGLVGKQLQKVLFDDPYGELKFTPLKWDLCPNIEEIAFAEPDCFNLNICLDPEESLRLKDVQSLLNSPMLVLRDLKLHCYEKGTKIKSFMDEFGSGSVTTLESISFGCHFPPANSFDSLVRMNKSLRDVSIHIAINQMKDDILWERVAEIAQCFFKAPALETFKLGVTIDCEPSGRNHALEEICRVKLRHRRIQVSLFGGNYPSYLRSDWRSYFIEQEEYY